MTSEGSHQSVIYNPVLTQSARSVTVQVLKHTEERKKKGCSLFALRQNFDISASTQRCTDHAALVLASLCLFTENLCATTELTFYHHGSGAVMSKEKEKKFCTQNVQQ